MGAALPSSPWSSRPQHSTAPSSRSEQVWEAPAASRPVTGPRPGARTASGGAELARPVAAPARHRPVGAERAREVAARYQLVHPVEAHYLERVGVASARGGLPVRERLGAHVGGRVPELALVVAPPAPHRSI